MPTISVIVPVYNTEKYLRRCLDSILAQTFADFELILVDDGSTDKSGAICDEYARNDSRVKSIHKINGGVSSARNLGLTESLGVYVLFCDSDDFVAPTWCEELLELILQYPDSLVLCDIAKDESETSFFFEKKATCRTIQELSYFQLYKKGLSAYSWNKIYCKNKILKLGISFNESVSFSEDVLFNVEYYASCNNVVFLNRKLYCYTQHEDSATGAYNSNVFSMHLLPFRCRLSLLEGQDLKEYCDIWLFHFWNLFENVFDPRNIEMTFLDKMRYNQKMISTDEFQFCLNHASLKGENPLYIKLMKQKNYFLLWLAQQAVKFKHRIGGVKE